MQNCSFLYNAATMPCFTHVCLVAIALALIIEFPLYGGGELPLREVSIMKQETGNTTCPPWFKLVCDNHDCNCTCGRSLQGIVDCSSSTQQIFLSDCYCMTVDRQVHTSIAVVGSCPYTCIVGSRWYSTPEELNNKTCGLNWNRRGQLCSQCQEGHSPAIYSYFLQCVPCTSWMTKDVIMVLSVSFLPLTFFCFVIIFFRVSAARPPLSTFILVSQMMAAPQYMQYKFAPHNVYQSTYICSTQSENLRDLQIALRNLRILRTEANLQIVTQSADCVSSIDVRRSQNSWKRFRCSSMVSHGKQVASQRLPHT